MKHKLTPHHAADYLDDAESISAYLREYIGDSATPDDIVAALGRIARAKGMADVAAAIGVGRESLYKSLAPGAKPRWETVVKVLAALGLTVTIVPASQHRATA